MVANVDDMLGYPDWPRLLSRPQTAAYVGVSPTVLDLLVGSGALPGPVPWEIRRRVWDRRALDLAIDHLSGFAGPSGITPNSEHDPIAEAADAYHAQRD